MTRTTAMQDYSDRVVSSGICLRCGAVFQPKDMGYNGRYCGKICKSLAKRAREKAGLADLNKGPRNREYVRMRMATDTVFKKEHQSATEVYRRATRKWLAEYKLERGCVDCGFKGHYAALQLDHEGPKSISIADARSSIARLQAEITAGQCQVRCANCHAVKTWERKQKALVDKSSIGTEVDQ